MCDMNIKRKIFLWLKDVPALSTVLNIAIRLNYILFHWSEREQTVTNSNGKSDKTYYVIRPRGRTEGLLSTYYYVMDEMSYAEQNGYIPIVDFDSNLCQYHVGYPVEGTHNAWEYFFEQPSLEKIDGIILQGDYKAVILSGWNFKKKNYPLLDVALKDEFMHEKCRVQPHILSQAEKLGNEFFGVDEQKTLGVFIRGTDYVRLQPKGHPIQPTVDQLITKIDLFNSLYNISKVYVVTEDYGIFQKLKARYGSMIFAADDRFVYEYNEKSSGYVESAFCDDPYERGKSYLIRLLLLLRCKYLIASRATGSDFVLDYKQGDFEAKYIFDLGVY